MAVSVWLFFPEAGFPVPQYQHGVQFHLRSDFRHGAPLKMTASVDKCADRALRFQSCDARMMTR
jgi:hypothetical protein